MILIKPLKEPIPRILIKDENYNIIKILPIHLDTQLILDFEFYIVAVPYKVIINFNPKNEIFHINNNRWIYEQKGKEDEEDIEIHTEIIKAKEMFYHYYKDDRTQDERKPILKFDESGRII